VNFFLAEIFLLLRRRFLLRTSPLMEYDAANFARDSSHYLLSLMPLSPSNWNPLFSTWAELRFADRSPLRRHFHRPEKCCEDAGLPARRKIRRASFFHPARLPAHARSGETTHALGAATLVLGAPGGSSSPSSTGTGRVDDYFWIAAAFDFAGVLGDWLLLIEILR